MQQRRTAAGTTITFRPLTRGDLPLLCEWLGRPHVVEWWGSAPSLAEVESEYGPLTEAGSSTLGFIAFLEGRPMGFIQSYVVLGSGDGWWEGETDPGARGIDQFLADGAHLGRGLGSAMVRAFVQRLFLDPAVTRVQTDPSPENDRAIRSYSRAGFQPREVVETPDGPALLMFCERGALLPPR
ncbi:MAG: GNAT family N-acetyltransferase [Acidobacteriota bacterium]